VLWDAAGHRERGKDMPLQRAGIGKQETGTTAL